MGSVHNEERDTMTEKEIKILAHQLAETAVSLMLVFRCDLAKAFQMLLKNSDLKKKLQRRITL
jgi:hypothetical protein